MPYFDENPLCKLAGQRTDADFELDLRGLNEEQALKEVEALLRAGSASEGRRIHIRFDAPRGDGSETLFLPLGRRLLAARKAGLLAGCLPAADGDGYHIVLTEKTRGAT